MWCVNKLGQFRTTHLHLERPFFCPENGRCLRGFFQHLEDNYFRPGISLVEPLVFFCSLVLPLCIFLLRLFFCAFCLLVRVREGFWTDMSKNAVLRSGPELGHSEHTFGPRLIAVQTFISHADSDAPKISSTRGAWAENGPHLRGLVSAESSVPCLPLFLPTSSPLYSPLFI